MRCFLRISEAVLNPGDSIQGIGDVDLKEFFLFDLEQLFAEVLVLVDY